MRTFFDVRQNLSAERKLLDERIAAVREREKVLRNLLVLTNVAVPGRPEGIRGVSIERQREIVREILAGRGKEERGLMSAARRGNRQRGTLAVGAAFGVGAGSAVKALMVAHPDLALALTIASPLATSIYATVWPSVTDFIANAVRRRLWRRDRDVQLEFVNLQIAQLEVQRSETEVAIAERRKRIVSEGLDTEELDVLNAQVTELQKFHDDEIATPLQEIRKRKIEYTTAMPGARPWVDAQKSAPHSRLVGIRPGTTTSKESTAGGAGDGGRRASLHHGLEGRAGGGASGEAEGGKGGGGKPTRQRPR